MATVRLEVGRSYRLLRPLEVRDDETGTLRHYLLKDTVITIRKVDPDRDQVWVDGVALPLTYFALCRHVAG